MFPRRQFGPTQLYTAIGQYLIYRSVLRNLDLEHPLYLAVPAMIYDTLFKALALPIVNEINMKLLIIDMEKEEIRQWID